MNRADCNGVVIGSVISHHTYATNGQQNTERLPDFAIESGFFDFGDKNIVRLLQKPHAFACDFAHDANAEARTRKWLPPDHVFGKSKFESYFANFVFEEFPQRFDQLQTHAFRQPTHVVMRLDGLRWAFYGDRFDDIRIECSLNEVFHTFGRCSLFLKYLDEFRSDNLSLFFRFRYAGQLAKESFGSIHSA